MTSNTVDLDFADGLYTFALPLPQIDELQRKTGIGIGGLLTRLNRGRVFDPQKLRFILDPFQSEFFALDIIETIRQGLIGGGKGVVDGKEVEVTATLANKLVQNYVLTKPLGTHWNEALAVLGSCIMGYDPPKKDEPADERAAGPQSETTDTSTTA